MTVSFPPTCSIRWWTVWASSSCPINTLWRPRPASTPCAPLPAGLLSHLHRKNAEKIAALVDVERLVIQDFIGTAPWDHRPLITVLVGQVVERLGEPDGVIAFDPSSFPKRGTHSVGVKRQWCGHRGKVDNCQVGVYMGYVSRHDHALLDFRLSLPEEWARDEQRRQECHVPQEVRYHTRHEQCLEMLDVWGEQVPHGWVTGDDELGRHARFRHALRERGERYVLGVPCNTTIRDLEAPLPAYQGRGRPPKPPWHSVTRLAPRTRPGGMDPLDGARRGERPCTIKEESRSGRVELGLGDPLARSAQKGLHLECRHRTCTRARETVGYLW